MNTNESLEKNLNNHKKNITKNNKIIFIICGVAIISILALVFVIVFIQSNKLSSDEEYAITIVEKYQDMLKDPDSIKLRGDVIVICAKDNNKERHMYCFFTASGSNSYGSSIQNSVAFRDGQYIDMNKNNYNYDLENSSLIQKYMIYLDVEEKLLKFNLSGEDSDSFEHCTVVDGNLVSKKLKISYNK